MTQPEFPTAHLTTLAESFRRDGLDGHHMVIRVALDAHAALCDRVARLERVAEAAVEMREAGRFYDAISVQKGPPDADAQLSAWNRLVLAERAFDAAAGETR